MNTQELQQLIIDRCHQSGACVEEFKLLRQSVDNPTHFARVLLSNHSWCIEKGIYSASELLMFEPETLRKAGLALPEYTSVDFERTTSIGGLDWMPLNEGATMDNLNGEYYTFDEAQLKFGLSVPSKLDMQLLAARPSQWGLYKSHFGRVFHGDDNNLFLPASGYRDASTGAFYNVGWEGFSWSSSVYDAWSGFYLLINTSAGVIPRYVAYRALGLPVRCVQNR